MSVRIFRDISRDLDFGCLTFYHISRFAVQLIKARHGWHSRSSNIATIIIVPWYLKFMISFQDSCRVGKHHPLEEVLMLKN